MTTTRTLRTLALRTILGAFPGTEAPPPWVGRLLREGMAGVVVFGDNITGRAQLRTLVASLRAERADAIVTIDEEGGDVTRLGYADGSAHPGNAALGAVGDPELTRAVYREIGIELAAMGITVDLAPSVDVNTADDNPVIGTRSFGADPKLVATHGVAAVAGLRDAGVAACVKHFPGHGATAIDSHYALPTIDVDLDLLRDRELVPFRAAIEAGVPAVMTAHIRVPTLTGAAPATFSARVIRDLLRGELGFGGAVVTDALEMRAASGQVGIPETAVRALTAGADLLCLGHRVHEPLIEATATAIVAAVEAGRLSRARLVEAGDRSEALVGPAVVAAPLDGAGQPEVSLAVARRALHVEGSVPQLHRPLVVQLGATSNLAVGDVPWGVTGHLSAAPGAEVLRVQADSTDPAADPTAVAIRAAGRPVVVVTRDTHRHAWARTFVEALVARHPDVVVVEMGWPAWRPLGARAYLATYGAARPNAQAAAEALLNHRSYPS